MNWSELVADAEELSSKLSDLVVTARQLRAQVVGTEQGLPGYVVLSGGKGSFRLTPWALRQVCRKLRIPEEYFLRLPPDIQATNLNHGLVAAPGKWLIRNRAQTAQGVLTPRYTPYGHGEVLRALARALEGTRVTVRHFHMDHELLYLLLTLDDYGETVGQTMDGHPDMHWPGLYIINSEVGRRRVGVNLGIWRLVCSNGLIRSEGEFRVVSHVHQNIQPEDLSATITTAAQTALETAPLVLGALIQARRTPVAYPLKVIDKIVKRHRLNSDYGELVGDEFKREPDATHFGIIQAFTAAARRLSANERLDLEELAGKLLDPEQVPGLARKRAVVTDSPDDGQAAPVVLKSNARLVSATFSLDGQWAAIGDTDGLVRILDAETGRTVLSLSGHDGAVHTIAPLDDGLHLVSIAVDRTIRIWEWKTGNAVQGHALSGAPVGCVAAMPGGMMVAGHEDGAVAMHHVWSGETVIRWDAHPGYGVTSVAVMPDHRYVLTGSHDGFVRLWDADTGNLVRDFGALMHQVFSLAVSWDGRRAMVGGIGHNDESSALLLGLTSGKILTRYDVPSELTSSVQFLQDGLQVLTAGGMMGDDCSMRVWDMRSGHELARLDLHTDDITTTALSAKTGRVLSVGSDRTLGLWSLPATTI